ncbi:hypothetical protein SM124_08075 [Bacillus sp. 31A1R]|uniref:Uncharacterized protein n=1 Tax=Robertmurraya mangrovi TaxID=3098077 RepID=A0ABU5IX40_9BACI|nr:hypothetical protein [Bacillus sp. 31A1R]MDZ5471701.1 hypothetical protein [Bacillus sp. 31A1R]
MRYLTKELYISHSFEQWEENYNKYLEEFHRLEPRFTKKAYKFFSSYSFHDAEILGFEIKRQYPNLMYPLEIIITVKDWNDDSIWEIKYKRVTNYEINISKNSDQHYLGIWGYQEFLPVNDKIISHEIMMIPQCDTLKIEFENKHIQINKVKNS